jgi:hypothetical protein
VLEDEEEVEGEVGEDSVTVGAVVVAVVSACCRVFAAVFLCSFSCLSFLPSLSRLVVRPDLFYSTAVCLFRI